MSASEANYEHFSNPRPGSAVSGGKRRARVLNDFTGSSAGELSLRADEVILVEHSSALDPAWMLGERLTGREGGGGGGGEKGKVPVAYLEILN